jgi:anti-sigma factor RsiW
MDCTEARTHWLDRRRGSLGADARAPLEAHLAGCEACRRDEAADRELSAALEARLPRRRAPEALRRSLEARWGGVAAPPAQRSRRVARTLLAMAAGAAIVLLAVAGWRARPSDDAMLAEAVNDHLRVLYSERPIEVEPGIHQVKPWFEGRLDFAPVVAFAGDDDFPLQGGAVAYFLDRKAATFVFKRRLHVITLFVFRADGLPWPAVASEPVGSARGTLRTSRGYHVLLWRKDDLGYALVSDVDARELGALGAKIAGGG